MGPKSRMAIAGGCLDSILTESFILRMVKRGARKGWGSRRCRSGNGVVDADAVEVEAQKCLVAVSHRQQR